MENIYLQIKVVSGILAGGISYFLGGWDGWLAALCSFMVFDFITGTIAGLMNKSTKTAGGGLESREMFRGGLRKILVLVIVAVAVVLDHLLLPGQTAIRDVVCGYYIAEEALSILENAGACGVNLPQVLVNVLEQLKKQSETENIEMRTAETETTEIEERGVIGQTISTDASLSSSDRKHL